MAYHPLAFQQSALDLAEPQMCRWGFRVNPCPDIHPAGSRSQNGSFPYVLRGEPCTKEPFRSWHCLPDGRPVSPSLSGPCRILARIPLYRLGSGSGWGPGKQCFPGCRQLGPTCPWPSYPCSF